MRDAVRRQWDHWSARPFPALILHFIDAIFRASDNPEVEIGLAGILGLLAVPGALLSFTLLDKYSSLLRWIRGHREADVLLTSIPDKYFFIVFSMVVTGMAAVLRWDRVFPGRLDFLNLAPLPVSLRAIFTANLAAMVTVAAIFAVTVNGASAILFPAIVTASQMQVMSFAPFAAAHAVVVMAASLFAFFACLAVMGALMAALPHAVFRRVSLYARVAMIMALLAVLATSFSVPAQLRNMQPGSPLLWLPPVWFLSLYQALQHRASPAMETVAGLALPALAASFLLALFFYGLSYRRHFLRLSESAGPAVGRGLVRWQAPAWLLRTPFLAACVPFGMKTLARSESHSLILGAFTGLGLVAAAQTLASSASPARLEAPLMIAYLVVCGTRFALEFPAGLRANWIFQTTVDPAAHQSPAVARRMILCLLVPGVIVPTAVAAGAGAAAWVLAFSLLLAEALLIDFRKIPFTCPLPQFGSNVTLTFAVVLAGFFAFTWLGASAAEWTAGRPPRLLAAAAGLIACGEAIRRVKSEIGPRSLEFREERDDRGLSLAG